MLTLCALYHWTLDDVRALTTREYHLAAEVARELAKAQAGGHGR